MNTDKKRPCFICVHPCSSGARQASSDTDARSLRPPDAAPQFPSGGKNGLSPILFTLYEQIWRSSLGELLGRLQSAAGGVRPSTYGGARLWENLAALGGSVPHGSSPLIPQHQEFGISSAPAPSGS